MCLGFRQFCYFYGWFISLWCGFRKRAEMRYPNWKKKCTLWAVIIFMWDSCEMWPGARVTLRLIKCKSFLPRLNHEGHNLETERMTGWTYIQTLGHEKKDLSRIKVPQFICVPSDRSFRLGLAVQDNPEEDKQEILFSDFFKSKEKKEKWVQIWREEENYIKQWIREILEMKTPNKPLCTRAWSLGACVTLKGGVWVISSVAT